MNRRACHGDPGPAPEAEKAARPPIGAGIAPDARCTNLPSAMRSPPRPACVSTRRPGSESAHGWSAGHGHPRGGLSKDGLHSTRRAISRSGVIPKGGVWGWWGPDPDTLSCQGIQEKLQKVTEDVNSVGRRELAIEAQDLHSGKVAFGEVTVGGRLVVGSSGRGQLRGVLAGELGIWKRYAWREVGNDG